MKEQVKEQVIALGGPLKLRLWVATALFAGALLGLLIGWLAGWSLPARAERDAAAPAVAPAAPATVPGTGPETGPELVRDPGVLAAGKRIYAVHCSRCHGLTGKGSQSTAGGGPNLRDDIWLHGSDFDAMVAIVHEGVAGTLMKSWRRDLGAERIQQVVAYIFAFRLEPAE